MNSTWLRICAETWMPWLNVTKLRDGEIIIDGPFADVLNLLAKLLKFKYKLLIPEDGQFGIKQPSGWTGMVGMVKRNICDMIIPLASTYERSQVVTYTSPPFITYMGILGGKTLDASNNIFGYFAVFQYPVWLTLFGCILIVSTLTLMGNTMYEIIKKPNAHSVARNIWNAKANFWVYFFEFLGTLLCEATPIMPKAHSSRLVLASWWMVVIVMMNTFGGMLKASMLMQESGNTIDSIKELVARTDVTPYLWKGSAYEGLVRDSRTPEFQAIWKRVDKANSKLPLPELFGLEMMTEVQRGKKVTLGDLPTIKYAVSTHCALLPDGEFHIGRQEFFGHTLGMAVSGNFNQTLLREMNKRILWLAESTLVQRWVSKQYGNLEQCTSTSSSAQKMLRMADFAAMFYLLVMCLGISAFVLIIETTCNKKTSPLCRKFQMILPGRNSRVKRRHYIVSKSSIVYSNRLILELIAKNRALEEDRLKAKRRPTRKLLDSPDTLK